MRAARSYMACALAAAAMIVSMPRAHAHHAFAAEFDANQPITLRGTVTRVEWMIEGGTPNTLLRNGLDRKSLPAGTEIVVDGYRAKSGLNRANGRDITLADGRKLFLGSSLTGSGGGEAAEKK